MENESAQGENPQETQKLEELGKELQGLGENPQTGMVQEQTTPPEPISPIQQQTKAPETQPPPNGSMNKVFTIAIIVLTISLIALGVYYFVHEASIKVGESNRSFPSCQIASVT